MSGALMMAIPLVGAMILATVVDLSVQSKKWISARIARSRSRR